MMMKRFAPLVVLLMLAGAKHDPLADRVAGDPVECISELEAEGQLQILDSQTIAYSRTAKRLWVSHTEGPCGGLRHYGRLVIQRNGAQLCRGDRFRTLNGPSSVPSSLCFFGAFTPFDKVEKR